ncbi:hypothetical protein Glove_682g37 [Diversispora epigaea]|uniref:RING-type domain-containing protein n=1 Tax=Diversispora epigaea TaxID=1348612 RepID=A0A397G7G1_9GLOM|nr:hypothetical protein Glove_682g37 [Diversispora epigaea]
MEADLRCNVVQCRKVLNNEGRACVTTCSLDCANNSFTSALVCPACETSLTENDDIVFTDLTPSEDYKSSVLSGLRPDIIMEICSRALSFWTYQTTQEACFQEMMYKSLEEKYTQLEKQVQGIMRDFQTEITTLRAKVQALTKDAELEKRKSHDLAEQLQEKGRQFSKLQSMYDKLKRRSLVPTIQQTINNTTTGIGNVGIGTRQSGVPIQRLYGDNLMSKNNRTQTWNSGNGQENIRDAYHNNKLQADYSIMHEQTPFNHPSSCNGSGGGRRMVDGNDINTFQNKASFTQTRTPFAMAASNSSMRLSNRGVK